MLQEQSRRLLSLLRDIPHSNDEMQDVVDGFEARRRSFQTAQDSAQEPARRKVKAASTRKTRSERTVDEESAALPTNSARKTKSKAVQELQEIDELTVEGQAGLAFQIPGICNFGWNFSLSKFYQISKLLITSKL